MRIKVRKWGNCLGLEIPESLANEASLQEGSTVHLSVSEGQIVVRSARSKKYELPDLLAQVTPGNRHGEISTGDPHLVDEQKGKTMSALDRLRPYMGIVDSGGQQLSTKTGKLFRKD